MLEMYLVGAVIGAGIGLAISRGESARVKFAVIVIVSALSWFSVGVAVGGLCKDLEKLVKLAKNVEDN